MRDQIQRKSMPANHTKHDMPSPAFAEASLNPAFSGHNFANISVFPKDAAPAQESGLSSNCFQTLTRAFKRPLSSQRSL